MIDNRLRRWRFMPAICATAWLVGAFPAPGAAASAGLAVVIANDYDGFLPGAPRDASAIADKLEASGFTAVRLLGAPGNAVGAAIEEVRKSTAEAGPFRMIYASGFGMCLNDDLVLFAEDMQPEQFKSGAVGDVAIPLSVVAAAAAEGGGQTLIVFDTNPNQCTQDALNAIKLPENSALLVTTEIGGDVIDEVDEGGKSAFATAFLQEFAPDRAPKDIVASVIKQIGTLTEEQQVPILVGELK